MRSLLITLLALPALAAEPAPKRPVVAVLYFDNQTNDRNLDVMQKGLADMMVTDLVASDAVTVVEREKFQAVVSELKLQRSKFFDPATAQKVGKMLGASHVVTGTILEAAAQLRLEVRVIELGSNAVLVTQKVTGPRDDIFELQQRLVELLLGSMRIKLGAAPPVKPARDVDTLLSYSRAVDAADNGDLVGAAASIAELLQRSPTFELGQDFKLALAKRMAAAGGARAQQKDAQRRKLLDDATAVLASAGKAMVSMGDLEAARHLTYRVLHAQCVALELRAKLTPREVHNVPDGAEAAARQLVEAYRADLSALEKELADWRGRWRWLPDPNHRPLLDALSLGPPPELLLQNVPGVARRWLGELTLLGRFALADAPFSMRPTPGELDPALVDGAARMMDDAAQLLAKAPAKAQPLEEIVLTFDAKATGLSTCGRRQQAVKVWQEVLEHYPTAKNFELVERHLKEALELTPDAVQRAEVDRAFAKAVSSCNAAELERTLPSIVSRRLADAGLWGIRPLLVEAERMCLRPGSQPALAAVYSAGAAAAEQHGDCGLFEKYATKLASVSAEKATRVRAEHPGCVH